ncbi:MAG TPA: Trm112 family protein [Nautiliaceae bacterium]|nr:Trm112 family protein [Nautiliaceae bacterium]
MEKEKEEKRLKELLNYICCPNCGSELELAKEESLFYLCKNCKRKYKIKEGIPILLLD